MKLSFALYMLHALRQMAANGVIVTQRWTEADAMGAH